MNTKCFFTLSLLVVFSLTAAGTAVANDLRGVCVGGGEWTSLTYDLDGFTGKTHFSLRANFPGKASGGKVYVEYVDGNWLVVETDSERVAVLYGTWFLTVGLPVEGYAIWGIGPVVDTNNADWKGTWALLGCYDGGKSPDNMDYLVAFAGLDPTGASGLYGLLLGGTQMIPFTVRQDKGNVKINLMD